MSSVLGPTVKQSAKQLIEALPETATWDDIMRLVYVRQCIESGLADADSGRVESVETIRARFGLKT